jgi:hypothetical protein
LPLHATRAELAPPNMPKPAISKSDFIRSLPSTMSPAEAVAKAKAQGLKLSRSLVYMVRGRPGGKAKKAAPKKTPTVTNGSAATSSVQSKADFVRSLPRDTPVRDVVEKAKVAGIKIGDAYVHNVRGRDAMVAKRGRKARTASVRKGAGVPRPIATTSSVEDLLKAVAAEIGLGRALEILVRERAKVRVMIAG